MAIYRYGIFFGTVKQGGGIVVVVKMKLCIRRMKRNMKTFLSVGNTSRVVGEFFPNDYKQMPDTSIFFRSCTR